MDALESASLARATVLPACNVFWNLPATILQQNFSARFSGAGSTGRVDFQFAARQVCYSRQ